MCVSYLELFEKWDKPTVYWPILTLWWIVFFILYIWSKDIWVFYSATLGFVAYLLGVHIRNYLRKKKK